MVRIMVEFKDSDSERFVTDSFSLDSGILTIKQDTVKCTIRLDHIKNNLCILRIHKVSQN